MFNATLPRPADREALIGFWAAISLLAGGGLGLMLLVSGIVGPLVSLLLGGAAVVALLTVGHLRERSVERLYLRWNRWARGYSRRAAPIILAIWYWTVFSLVGRIGEGRMDLRGTPWSDRDTLSALAYADPGGAPTDRDASGGVRDFVGWALRSGHAWSLVLLPLFALLQGLDTQKSATGDSNIYTLY